MRASVECLSKNSFQSSKVSSGKIMILTSFLRSNILLIVPLSFETIEVFNSLVNGYPMCKPDVLPTDYLVPLCWLGMVEVVRRVVKLGYWSESNRVQIPHNNCFPLLQSMMPFFPHPSIWSSIDATMLCWPFMIMNFLFLISLQSLSFALRKFPCSSTRVRQIFCH